MLARFAYLALIWHEPILVVMPIGDDQRDAGHDAIRLAPKSTEMKTIRPRQARKLAEIGLAMLLVPGHGEAWSPARLPEQVGFTTGAWTLISYHFF